MHNSGRRAMNKRATTSSLNKPLSLVIALALGLLIAGCCGGGGAELQRDTMPPQELRAALPEATRVVPAQPAGTGTVPGGLAAPGELARGASFVDADRFRAASDFEAALPNNRVNPGMPFLQFSPTNGEGSAAFDRCAFAIYSYLLDGFSGDLSFKSSFVAAPPAGGGFIGLANWDAERWDWFVLEPGTQQQFGDSTPFVREADGAVLACILVVRQGATLGFLRVGDNIAPSVSSIDVTPGTTAVVDGIVTFSAVAADLDGALASYDWDVDGQPGFEVLGGTETVQFSYPAEGQYTSRVRVSDNDGAESAEFDGPTVTIIPAAANEPPVAALQSSVSGGTAPLQVDFDASASADPDGSISTYEWDFDGDGTFFAGDTTMVPTNSHNFDAPGDYNATVRVTDNLGATDTASVLISVGADMNQAPAAAFKPDFYFTDAPLGVLLDAGDSTDADGTIDKYEWDWDNNGSFDEDLGANPQVNHSFPNPGTYPVTLRVTDNDGATDTLTVTLIADDGPNGHDDQEPNDNKDTPQALPGIGFKDWDARIGDGDVDPEDEDDWYSFSLDAFEAVEITMNFTHSECDIDMKLFESDGTTELDSSTSTTDMETLNYASTTGGTYLLRVYKFSSDALKAANYTLNGTRTEGTAPVAALTADVSSGPIPLLVNFDATGSYDPGGGAISSYDFDFDGNGTYDTTGDTDGLASHTYTGIGSFNAVVRVHNTLGFTDTAGYLITTDDNNGNSPTADIQADATEGAIAFTVNFDASGSTAPNGGTIDNYEWDLDGNGVFETDTGAVATQSATYFKTGSYNATVRVTSNLGVTDTASISVTATGTMDEQEANNDYSSGQTLPLMPFSGFFGDLGPGGNDGGNEDWYTFTLAADATVTLTMNLHDNFGDLDMKLYASDGTTEEGTSTGTDNDEVITKALTAGTYYLKCYVFTSNTTNGPGRGGYELQGSSS